MKGFRDFYTGKIIERSIQTRWNKTFFYVYSGKDKVLVILEGDTVVPEDLDRTYKFSGDLIFSSRKRILKLHTYLIEPLPDVDYREELRLMMDKMRNTAS